MIPGVSIIPVWAGLALFGPVSTYLRRQDISGAVVSRLRRRSGPGDDQMGAQSARVSTPSIAQLENEYPKEDMTQVTDAFDGVKIHKHIARYGGMRER